MASLRNFFAEEKRKRDESLAQKPQSIEDDADFERIMKINDEWNRNVAKIREARLAKERTDMRKRIEWELEQQRQYEEEERIRVNEMVLKEKVCKCCTMYLPVGPLRFTNLNLFLSFDFHCLGSCKIVHSTGKF